MKNFFKDRQTFLLFRLPLKKDWAFLLYLAFLSFNIFAFLFLSNRVPQLAIGVELLFRDFNIFKLLWSTYFYFLPILIIRIVISFIRIRRIKDK